MKYLYTADFMKKVPGVYTHSMETIYLSPRDQVAGGTYFRKSPVLKNLKLTNFPINKET